MCGRDALRSDPNLSCSRARTCGLMGAALQGGKEFSPVGLAAAEGDRFRPSLPHLFGVRLQGGSMTEPRDGVLEAESL